MKILFLCTGNSARSILGEYLLRHHGEGRFETFSAGAQPTGRVHPLAQRVLQEDYGLDASDARSESVTEYLDVGLDVVISVCDHARDTCPVFPGKVTQAHWGLPDPAAFEGPENEGLDVFRGVAVRLEEWIRELKALPIDKMSPVDLAAALNKIARTERPA